MFRQLSLIILLLIGHLTSAQQVKVLSYSHHQPIEDVYIFSSTHSTLTNKMGLAKLDNFTSSDTIHFQHPSFQNLSLTVDQISELNYLIYLKSSIVPIEEIVVSAHKWEQNSTEIPLKIVKINHQEIINSSAQTSADLLKATNQVFIQKSQLGGGSPMIRGFSANRVLLVLDGVRLNNAIYRSGNLQNVLNIDPNSLESAEVILGPGSIIYGSDAIGGVMDFHTLKPKLSTSKQPQFDLKYKSRYSSANNEIMNHAQYNLGTERVGFTGAITYSDFSDLKMGSNGPKDYLRPEYVIRENGQDKIVPNPNPKKQINSAYSQLNLLQKVRWKTTNKTEILYNFQYSETSDVPRYDRLIQYSGEQLKYAQWYYGPQKLQFHSFQLEHKKSNRFYDSFRLNSAYQNYQESRHSRKLSSSSLKSRTEKLNIISVNADVEKKLSNKFHMYYGSEWTFNQLYSKGHSKNINDGTKTTIASRYPDDSKYSSLAFYSNLTWKIKKNWTLNSGIRYSHVWIRSTLDNTFYDFPFENLDLSTGALTYGIGITHKSKNGWHYKFNTTTGFRAPNIDDIGKVFDSEPGKVVVPNDDLQPEYVYNFEMNANKSFSNKLYLDFGLFYSYLDQAMTRENYSFGGDNTIIYDGVESEVQAIVNADNAKVWGGSINVTAKVTDQFSATSNLTYTKGEYKDGSPVRHVPPLFGNLSFRYNNSKFTSKLEFEYNGEISYSSLANTEKDKAYLYAKDENGNPYSPDWMTINLINQYQLTKKIQVTANIENILDKRYRPYSSGICAPGRNFIIGLSYKL